MLKALYFKFVSICYAKQKQFVFCFLLVFVIKYLKEKSMYATPKTVDEIFLSSPSHAQLEKCTNTKYNKVTRRKRHVLNDNNFAFVYNKFIYNTNKTKLAIILRITHIKVY